MAKLDYCSSVLKANIACLDDITGSTQNTEHIAYLMY